MQEFWKYYRVIRKGWRTITIILVVALMVGGIVAWPRNKEYSSSVTLTTTPPDESRYLLVLVSDRTQAAPAADSTASLAIELIRSRTVAERVIQRLNLKTDPQELRSRLQVARTSPADVLTLTVRDPNPAQAVLLANTYAETAVAYNQEVNRRETGLARQYIEQQLQDTSVRLRQAEDALDAFKRQHGIVAMDAQMNSKVGGYIELQNQQRAAAISEREIDARIADIRQRLNQSSPTRSEKQLTDSPVTQQLKSQLAALQVQLTMAETTYTEENPAVIALKQKIKALQQTLATEVSKSVSLEYVQVNPLYDGLLRSLIDLETQRVAFQAQQAALASIIPTEQQKMPELNQMQRDYTRLTRDVQVLDSTYTTLQTRLSEFKIREEAAVNQNLVYILDPALTALPTSPSKALAKVLLAGMLGLMGGVGVTLFQYQIDDTLKNGKDLEQSMRLPLLSSIPKQNPPFDEAYRMLKTSLGLHAADAPPKALMFTSPRPGSGTSTVVYHLAGTIARGGKRVIVLDADLRRPTAHRLFGVYGEHGLVEVLNGVAGINDSLRVAAADNVRVLPAGTGPAPLVELPELFSSPAMVKLLAGLKEDADIILIDTPPPVPFAETRALASLVDGVVLVVAAGQSLRGIEQDTKRILERAHARLLGTVVNKVAPENDDTYFYYEKYSNPDAEHGVKIPVATIGVVLLLILGAGIVGILAVKVVPPAVGWVFHGGRAVFSWLGHVIGLAASAVGVGISGASHSLGRGASAGFSALAHSGRAGAGAVGHNVHAVTSTAGSATRVASHSAGHVGHGIGAAFAGLGYGIAAAFVGFGHGIAAAFLGLGHGIAAAVAAAVRGISFLVGALGWAVTSMVLAVGHGIQAAIGAVADGAYAVMGSVGFGFQNVVQGVGRGIQVVVFTAGHAFQGLLSGFGHGTHVAASAIGRGALVVISTLRDINPIHTNI
jgi:capsular exopolysaccharide synthesis family protein